MTSAQVTVIAYLTIPPGTEQGVLDRFGEVVAKTRAEPGCINYDFHQHPAEPFRFVFYENYGDQAAFDAHLTQPYIRTWAEYIDVQGGRFDVEAWTMLSQPSRNNI